MSATLTCVLLMGIKTVSALISVSISADYTSFQTSDKAVLEIFSPDEAESLATQLVKRFVNPGEEIGGDSRLSMPSARSIRSGETDRDGQASSSSMCQTTCFLSFSPGGTRAADWLPESRHTIEMMYVCHKRQYASGGLHREHP